MKNTKKAEQKRRAVERRASEGDAEHFASSSGDGVLKAGSWMNVRYSRDDDDKADDSHTDSGMASSMEETSHIPRQKMSSQQIGLTQSGTRNGKEQPKASQQPQQQQQQQQSQTKKKLNSGQFLKEANPDLIFDLDF